MIQKCPHCHRDVIFSRDICPACGYTSSEEERNEPTALEIDRRTGKNPTYTGGLEEAMNATQTRGRTLLGLIILMVAAPAVVHNVVRIFWLMPDIPGLIGLLVLAYILKGLWEGRRFGKPLTLAVTGIGGVMGPLLAVVYRRSLNPVAFLACTVFGAVYLICCLLLWTSRDVPEFLKVQRRWRGEDGGLPSDR